MNPDGGQIVALGVDVGGTKIAVGGIRADGSDLPLGQEPTLRGDGHGNAETVRKLLRSARESAMVPVGLSVTTTVDHEGRLRDAAGWLGWSGWTAADIVGTDSPALAANDAMCGAVAEQRVGAGQGAASMLYVTLGTGLAHAFVVGGSVWSGAHNAALFSGWSPAGAAPGASTWEELCAGPALARRFDGGADARPLAAAVRRADPFALRVLDEGADALAAYLALLVQTMDPDVVVVGGGLASGFPEYVRGAIERCPTLYRQQLFADTPFTTAALGNASCWMGAALIAQDDSRLR
ncbi:ROK family protein [Leifsonia sp. LS-T14]|uniref:ROK family protein n=1 Tax=unclassified Leifsonia TaxID=2663824 RepID=UPI0035A6F0B8